MPLTNSPLALPPRGAERQLNSAATIVLNTSLPSPPGGGTLRTATGIHWPNSALRRLWRITAAPREKRVESANRRFFCVQFCSVYWLIIAKYTFRRQRQQQWDHPGLGQVARGSKAGITKRLETLHLEKQQSEDTKIKQEEDGEEENLSMAETPSSPIRTSGHNLQYKPARALQQKNHPGVRGEPIFFFCFYFIPAKC